MADIEKVKKALQICVLNDWDHCRQCPYWDEDCDDDFHNDILEVIEELEERIAIMEEGNKMTKHEYDELQVELSNLLEKKDVGGRKIRRSQDYKDAVLAARSVLHNYFMFHNEEGEQNG